MELVDIPANPLPPGAEAIGVASSGGITLRVARWMPTSGGTKDCPGTVMLLPGRTEFIEKYAEIVGELLGRGFAVVALDWRGQGGSTRLLRDPRRGHVRRFADFVDDVEAVVSTVLRTGCPGPSFALAHSMGGAVALEHARTRGPTFSRMVLSAPMLGIFGLRRPRGARRLAAALTGLGRGSLYIPGGSDRSWMTSPFAGNALTSDPRRYAAFQALAEAAPHLLIGSPTVGWVHAAFRVMDGLAAPGALEAIATPVLAVACGADRVVDTWATDRLIGRLKVGRCIVLRHALHEVMMERASLRSQFWAAFDAFIPGSGASSP